MLKVKNVNVNFYKRPHLKYNKCLMTEIYSLLEESVFGITGKNVHDADNYAQSFS